MEFEGLRPKGVDSSADMKAPEPGGCPSSMGREQTQPSSAFLFYISHQQIGRGPTHWGEPPALLSPLIQMLIFSKNTLMEHQNVLISFLNIPWPSVTDM